MKLIAYEILTQMIMILGWLREALKITEYRRIDRTLYAFFEKPDGRSKDKAAAIGCCDCGLTHYVWLDEKYENLELANPVRPKDYKYRFRLFGEKASFFEGYNGIKDYLVGRT